MLVLCAALWSVGSYGPTGHPVLSHLGFAFGTWYDVALALLILALPARWPNRGDRLVLGTLAAAFGIRSLSRLLLLDPPMLFPDCLGCPTNPFAVAPNLLVFESIEIVAGLVIAGASIVVAATALRRLVRGSRAVRRVMWPVLVAGCVAMGAAALGAADSAASTATGGPLLDLPEPWSEVAGWGGFIARVLIPIGFLAGTLRMDRGRTDRPTGGGVRSPAFARTSGERTTGSPGRSQRPPLRREPSHDAWIDVDGHRVPLPDEGPLRAVTRLEGNGGSIAAIVHDPVLREDPSLIGAVTAVLRLGVQNERLEAEVRAQLLDAVRASRVRLVGAAEEERRRLERDLHDGAQQRLVGVSLALQRARAAADDPAIPSALRDELDRTASELQGAIVELRSLLAGSIQRSSRMRASPLPWHPSRAGRASPSNSRSSSTAGYRAASRRPPTSPSPFPDERRPVRSGRIGTGVRRRPGPAPARRGRGRRGRWCGSGPWHRLAGRGRSYRGARRTVRPAQPEGRRHPDQRRNPGLVTAANPIRVIVADNSAVIRQGVVRILSEGGMTVVAEARDADELLAAVAADPPDLAVIDIRMPPTGNAGLAAAVAIRERHRGRVAVLVLSQFLEPEYALRLLANGADGVGYLLKDRLGEADQLLEAARRVTAGGSAIDPAVVDELVRARRSVDRVARLTDREREILGLVAQGRSNRSIATVLSITPGPWRVPSGSSSPSSASRTTRATTGASLPSSRSSTIAPIHDGRRLYANVAARASMTSPARCSPTSRRMVSSAAEVIAARYGRSAVNAS